MTESDSVEIVRRFIDRINAGDVDGLCALMPEDHVFIDAGGQRYGGRETLRQGWQAYLKLFPDYRVEIESMFGDGTNVAVFGNSSATYGGESGAKDDHWDCPAAWLAVVRDGLIAEWRVYADNEAARQILTRHEKDT